MNKMTISVLFATTLALSAVPAFAAQVGGNAEIKIKTGTIKQDVSGIANQNQLNVGSVKGGNTRVGGNVSVSVKTGTVIQKTSGIANKNEANIGGVAD